MKKSIFEFFINYDENTAFTAKHKGVDPDELLWIPDSAFNASFVGLRNSTFMCSFIKPDFSTNPRSS